LSFSGAANSCSSHLEFLQLQNPKTHYRRHKSTTLYLVFIHYNYIRNFTTYFCKPHSNIILPSTPRFVKWSITFRFINLNSKLIYIYFPTLAIRNIHLVFLYLITLTIITLSNYVPSIKYSLFLFFVWMVSCTDTSRGSSQGGSYSVLSQVPIVSF
jgi:hypothetical protein